MTGLKKYLSLSLLLPLSLDAMSYGGGPSAPSNQTVPTTPPLQRTQQNFQQIRPILRNYLNNQTTVQPQVQAAPPQQRPVTNPQPETTEPPPAPLPPPRTPPSPMDSAQILSLIESQINAIQKNDLISAYNDFTTGQFRNATTLDEFKYFITSYPVFTNTKNAYFGNADVKGDYATIQGTISSVQGDNSFVTYYLAREGGNWKILGIDLPKPTANEQQPEQQPYDFQGDIEQ